MDDSTLTSIFKSSELSMTTILYKYASSQIQLFTEVFNNINTHHVLMFNEFERDIDRLHQEASRFIHLLPPRYHSAYTDELFNLRCVKSRNKYFQLLFHQYRKDKSFHIIPANNIAYAEMRTHNYKLQTMIDNELPRLNSLTDSFRSEKKFTTVIHRHLIERNKS